MGSADVLEDDWLIAVLGPSAAATVTHREDHHGGIPDDTPETPGTVTRIRAVSCRFAPHGSDDKVYNPVAGTGSVVDVERADGRFVAPGDLVFNGYLVDLDVD